MTILDNKTIPTDDREKIENNAENTALDMQLFWQNSRAGQALLFSLFSGIIGVNLFADLPLGLNVLCFAVLALLGFVGMRFMQKQSISKIEGGLIGLVLFFVASLVWRESIVLNTLSVMSLLLLGIVAFSVSKQRQWNAWYLRHSGKDSLAAIRYVVSTPLHLGRISYQESLSLLQRLCDKQTSEAVVRGLLFATPIIVLFALLLMNADARFESSITHLFDWDLGALWSNAGLFILCFILAATLQRAAGVLIPQCEANKEISQEITQTLEHDTQQVPVKKTYRIEIGIILALVNVLFLSFVWVQFSYFFGGDAMVQDLNGPSYSEYARRGFFQLLVVAILVMLLLLSSYVMFKPSTSAQQRWFQVLAGSLIVLTWIIELSAVHRMFIYVQAYGLTELRFYSSVMMLWVAGVLLWFSLSVLRNQAGLFLFGTVMSLLLSVALLHVINPDATIMRTNLERLATGQHFDVNYMQQLSADMIPTVAQHLPYHNEKNKNTACTLSTLLTQATASTDYNDSWLAWHWARYQSQQAMQKMESVDCSL
jgi:hypothetical protein